jgi:hypothetical protein
MPALGTPAFNAVSLIEVEHIDFASSEPPVARAAFVNTNSGATYGSTTCRTWSPTTLEKLAELRQAMEEDIASLVFEQGPAEGALDSPGRDCSNDLGLLEHLEAEASPI